MNSSHNGHALQVLIKYLSTALLLILLYSCARQPEASPPSEGFINLDEAGLYYSASGLGDTLIILHGGPGLSHKYLKPQLDTLLAPKFTLLYYDQRGSGWSKGERDSSKLNMETFVSDLDQLRMHFGLSKLNLVGHSFGGLLAMYYGITHPENLNSLVLIDSDAASYELRTPYQVKMINERLSDQLDAYLDSIEQTTAFKQFDPAIYEKYYKVFLTSYFADPMDTSNLELGFDSISVPKISRTNAIVRADLGNYDIHDQLPKITCRSMIMQGTESIFSVEGAEAMHHALRNSELHLFEHCGHFEFIESPQMFQQFIEEFYEVN